MKNKCNKAFALAMVFSIGTFIALLNTEKLSAFQGLLMLLGVVTGICWSRFFALNKKTALATAHFNEKMGDSIENVLDKPQLFVFRMMELGILWLALDNRRYDIAIICGMTLVCVEYLIYKGTHQK